MFGYDIGFDLKKIKEKTERQKIQLDEAGSESSLAFEDIVEFAKLFTKLRELIVFLLSAKDLGIENWDNFLELLTDDLNDEEAEEFADLVYKFLKYIGVPDSSIENLMSEDEELSQAEFESIIDLLIERIGEGDVDEFIVFAITNPELEEAVTQEVELDSIQMDWAFYPSLKECKEGAKDADRQIPYNPKTQQCVRGYRYGVIGYWRYPKGDFPNGTYRRKNKGTRGTAPAGVKEHLKEARNKAHVGRSEKELVIDNKKRAKRLGSAFLGYIPNEELRKKIAKKIAKKRKAKQISKSAKEALA